MKLFVEVYFDLNEILLLKITIYRFDLKKIVIPDNNKVPTFTLVHHSFLIKC